MSSIVEFSLGRQKNSKWSRGLGMLIDNKDVQGGVTEAKTVMLCCRKLEDIAGGLSTRLISKRRDSFKYPT